MDGSFRVLEGGGGGEWGDGGMGMGGWGDGGIGLQRRGYGTVRSIPGETKPYHHGDEENKNIYIVEYRKRDRRAKEKHRYIHTLLVVVVVLLLASISMSRGKARDCCRKLGMLDTSRNPRWLNFEP